MTHYETTSAGKTSNPKPTALRAIFAKVIGVLAGLNGTATSNNLHKNARRDVFEDLNYPNEAVLRS